MLPDVSLGVAEDAAKNFACTYLGSGAPQNKILTTGSTVWCSRAPVTPSAASGNRNQGNPRWHLPKWHPDAVRWHYSGKLYPPAPAPLPKDATRWHPSGKLYAPAPTGFPDDATRGAPAPTVSK